MWDGVSVFLTYTACPFVVHSYAVVPVYRPNVCQGAHFALTTLWALAILNALAERGYRQGLGSLGEFGAMSGLGHRSRHPE